MYAVVLALMLALSASAGLASQTSAALRAPSLADADRSLVVEARVTRAVDGNALDAHINDHRTLVGYLGVETAAPNQPCGREARARNRELAGSGVLLEEDPAFPFDERGRRLYYAYTLDGISVDETLVREGLARAARPDARYGAYLTALQAEAEAEHRGCLWSETAGS